jgi:hypothetical protein
MDELIQKRKEAIAFMESLEFFVPPEIFAEYQILIDEQKSYLSFP